MEDYKCAKSNQPYLSKVSVHQLNTNMNSLQYNTWTHITARQATARAPHSRESTYLRPLKWCTALPLSTHLQGRRETEGLSLAQDR